MDPDHVADAGVQHQRDDLGGSATSADGGCDDSGSGDSWARALLRRGWDLSRKAAIAGVAATAAPVVAPPLLVLSLTGVALSLPFAAYLASLAATDRLMSALLPAPPTQPYHACDLEDDDGFLDASGAPAGEAPAFDHWCDTENDDAVVEDNESIVSLPLSREPRFWEEPAPSSTDVEDKMAEGEFSFRELSHESLVLDSKEQGEESTTMEDTGYITMEAPPRGSNVSGSAVLVLRDEDNMLQRVVEAPFTGTANESVQELSVSDSGDRTEDGKSKDTEEMEPLKEILSLGVEITELDDFPVPVLGNEGIVVQRGDEEKNSVPKSGQDSHLTDIEDKLEGHRTKEEIPLQEANVSESSVLDDTMLDRTIAVEMVVKEVSIDTDPSTGEVDGEQVDFIATALPESELQATVKVANVDDIIDAALTEDIVLNIGDTSTQGMEHYGEGGVSGVIPAAVTVDEVAEIVSSRSPAASGITDDMTSIKNRPDADRSNQTTGYTQRSKEFREKRGTEDKRLKTEENKTMDDKVPTRSMSPQITDVSKSPVPDNKSKIEEVTVETVLEEVTSNTEDLVTREVAAVQLNIIASENELPSVSDHVDQGAVSEAAAVDEIRGSTVIEDVKTGFSDRTSESVEHHSDRGTCSFVTGVPVVTVGRGEDLVSSRSTPHASARDSASSVEGALVFDNRHQTTAGQYKPVDEGFRRNAVVGEQVDFIATALPESESLQVSGNLVAQELHSTVEVANIDDIIDAALTEDIVLNIGDTSTQGMEHYGEGDVSSVVPAVTVDDVAEIVSSRSPAASGISDDMTSVKSRPDTDHSTQTTGYTQRNKEFQEKGGTEDKRVKAEENKTMDDKMPTRSMAPQITDVSKSPMPDDKSKIEDELVVETVLEEVTSNAEDLVTREVVAVQLNVIASENELPSVSDHVAQGLQAESEAAVVDEIPGSTVIEDIKTGFSDRKTESVEHHSDRGSCSFVTGVPEVTVGHGGDLVSSRSTPHASARDSASSVEGAPVFDNPHQTTGGQYKPVDEGFRRNAVAEDMDNYTEEQLREQLDTLRTITGYHPAPSMTLEAELVGLYIFVGVEPPVSSRDSSNLNDLNTKLRFLKSIIGVE